MRKLNGITINGEYLGNSVVINGMFRAICTISPIIMRNFVLMINKIDFLDEAVKISNFNCDNYKNSIDIEFKNETSQGIASLYFELEQGMPVLSDCKLIVENDEYEYEYDAETLSIDEPESYEVEDDEEEFLQQEKSDEQEDMEQEEDTIKKEQIDDIESDTSPEQNEIITPKIVDTEDKRTETPINDDIVHDVSDSEKTSEYKAGVMEQSLDEDKTKFSKKTEKNRLSEYSDNVVEDEEFEKQEDDTIDEMSSDNRPKPIKRPKRPNVRRKNRPNEHGEDDSSLEYPEEFNEGDYEEEYNDNEADFSDFGEVSKEVSSSGHRQNPHKNRRNPKNTQDNYYNEINDSNPSFTDEEFSLDFSDDNTAFSDFNESNESSDDNFSFEETKPIPRNKSKKQKKQARPTNIDFDDTVFDFNNDESTDNIEDDEESDEQFYKNAMKLSSNMKQCTIIAKTIKIEASNFDNLPDGLHPKNNMDSNMMLAGAGMGGGMPGGMGGGMPGGMGGGMPGGMGGGMPGGMGGGMPGGMGGGMPGGMGGGMPGGMGGGMPGGMGGGMPGGMGGGMPGGMGGGMPGGMGGGMPGGYNVDAFQYQMAMLQAQMEMLRQQSDSRNLMTLDQFKAQQKAMEEVQEQKRRQNFRIVGSKEHIRANALNGGVYVSGKKVYKWGDTRTLND